MLYAALRSASSFKPRLWHLIEDRLSSHRLSISLEPQAWQVLEVYFSFKGLCDSPSQLFSGRYTAVNCRSSICLSSYEAPAYHYLST